MLNKKKKKILHIKGTNRLLYGLSGLIILTLILIGFAWHTWLPWTANHFGFALLGKRGLPYAINYNGRQYINHSTCAYADWCRTEESIVYQQSNKSYNELCVKVQEIQQLGDWPLVQVATIWTLGGSNQAVLARKQIIQEKRTFMGTSQLSIMALYVPNGNDCYTLYSLSGGP